MPIYKKTYFHPASKILLICSVLAFALLLLLPFESDPRMGVAKGWWVFSMWWLYAGLLLTFVWCAFPLLLLGWILQCYECRKTAFVILTIAFVSTFTFYTGIELPFGWGERFQMVPHQPLIGYRLLQLSIILAGLACLFSPVRGDDINKSSSY